MDSLEKEIWETIDIKGLGSHVLISSLCLEGIKRYVRKYKNVEEDWKEIKEHYRNIPERAKKIDLSKLDDRFPVEIVREVKEDIIPKLRDEYEDLGILLDRYKEGEYDEEQIIHKVEVCQSIIKRLGRLGIEFRTPRFLEYAKIRQNMRKNDRTNNFYY